MFPYERIEDQFTFYTLYIFLYQKMFTWVDQLISETNFSYFKGGGGAASKWATSLTEEIINKNKATAQLQFSFF